MPSPLDNIFGETEEEKKKKQQQQATTSSPAVTATRTVKASPLDDIFAGAPSTPTPKQVQVDTAAKEQSSGFFDKALNVVGKVVTGVGNFINRQQQKNDMAGFEISQLMYGKNNTFIKDPVTGKNKLSNPTLDAYKNATSTEEKLKIIEAEQQKAPLMQFLNSNVGRKITGGVASATSNVPLKIWAGVKALGDDTYDEAYSALLAKEKDPNNTRFEKIMYGLQDSGVQSAIGALLAVGASVLTKNPKVGQAVSLAYFAPISAESQRADNEKGNVTSIGNVAIDTIGDTVISGFAESALKNVIKEGGEAGLKTFAKEMTKGFVVEGSTEPAQTFLKYANDYKNAKSEDEKKKVVDNVTQYVKSGGMVDEFLIGGLSGAGITGVAAGSGKFMGEGGEVSPSLQSEGVQEGTAPVEGEAPKVNPVKGELNTDFSEVRDEAINAQNELRADPENTDMATHLTNLQSQLTDYQNAVKERPVYISSDTQENPLATVETVQYPDGKYASRFSVDIGTKSLQSPFITNELYDTKVEAVDAAQKQILDWVQAQKDGAQGEEVAKLNEIETEVKGKATTQEKPAQKLEDTTKKEGAKPLANQSTQVNPNVEKTAKGVYRTTQYTQKGEAQGKAEARYTKSKKTGKLYFEVMKDGERIERLSLERAKKKYGTTDRPTMVERAVNGKKNADGTWELRQSNAPVIRNTTQNQVEKKPVKTKGEVKKSKAFARVQERLGEAADMDVSYNRLNLAEDTAKALEFVEKNPKEAKRIALGMQGAPEGVTETAISIALAEKAAENKDYALQAQLERSRSLRQTRRGQEIVSERGRFNENSSHFFMQQVLAARIENAGKTRFKFLSKNKGENIVTGAEAKMKEGTQAIKETVKKKLSAADLAQSVIDQLTC